LAAEVFAPRPREPRIDPLPTDHSPICDWPEDLIKSAEFPGVPSAPGSGWLPRV